MKKIVCLAGLMSLFPFSVMAHQAYIAPLGSVTHHQQVIVHAGYTEELFVPEFALEGKFYLTSPAGQHTELTANSGFKSASILEVPLPEKGTYSITATAEHPTNYAQQDGQWKAVYDVAADKAPVAGKRDWLLPSEVKATARKLVSTSHTQVQTYVSRDTPSPVSVSSASGNFPLALKFVQHPNQIESKNGLKFTVLINGKPTAGIKFTLHAAGEQHDEDNAKENMANSKHLHPAGFVSNSKGEVVIPLAQAGQYLIDSHYPDIKKGAEPASDTYHYVLTIQAK